MKNDSPFRDESEANPEKASLDAERSDTVLEKLKYCEEVLEFRRDYLVDNYYEDEDVERVQQCLNLLPCLIAALELVEAKAKEVTSYDVWGGVPQEPKVDFAREIRAVVNGETKGE